MSTPAPSTGLRREFTYRSAFALAFAFSRRSSACTRSSLSSAATSAAGWLAFEIVNIAWPRLPDAPWYVNWSAVLMVVLVALLGLVVRAGTRIEEMPEPVPVAA